MFTELGPRCSWRKYFWFGVYLSEICCLVRVFPLGRSSLVVKFRVLLYELAFYGAPQLKGLLLRALCLGQRVEGLPGSFHCTFFLGSYSGVQILHLEHRLIILKADISYKYKLFLCVDL